jgi:TonB family protein
MTPRAALHRLAGYWRFSGDPGNVCRGLDLAAMRAARFTRRSEDAMRGIGGLAILVSVIGFAAGAPASVLARPVPAPAAADTTPVPLDGRVYGLDEVEVQPELQNSREVFGLIRLYYPSLERDAGVQGTVVLRWVIGADGRAERSTIRVTSTTHPDFDEPARRVAARMRFSPAMVNGKPVRVEVILPVTFTLR